MIDEVTPKFNNTQISFTTAIAHAKKVKKNGVHFVNPLPAKFSVRECAKALDTTACTNWVIQKLEGLVA